MNLEPTLVFRYQIFSKMYVNVFNNVFGVDCYFSYYCEGKSTLKSVTHCTIIHSLGKKEVPIQLGLHNTFKSRGAKF